MISLSIRLQPFPPFVVFQALGGVDDAAECRHAVDADLFEFVTVAVVRRLMRHARIERIAQGRILLRDVPAMHAHLPPSGGMPPSAAPSATFGEVLHIARKLAYLVLELVLGGFDFPADSLAHFIDFFDQFRVAFKLLHLLAFDAFLAWRNAAPRNPLLPIILFAHFPITYISKEMSCGYMVNSFVLDFQHSKHNFFPTPIYSSYSFPSSISHLILILKLFK